LVTVSTETALRINETLPTAPKDASLSEQGGAAAAPPPPARAPRRRGGQAHKAHNINKAAVRKQAAEDAEAQAPHPLFSGQPIETPHEAARRHAQESAEAAAAAKEAAAQEVEAAARAAANGTAGWPRAKPGTIADWMSLECIFFRHMRPMPDFAADKLVPLAQSVIKRVENIEAAPAYGQAPRLARCPLFAISEAIMQNGIALDDDESEVRKEMRRYGSTPFVRFLGTYLKEVEEAGRLVAWVRRRQVRCVRGDHRTVPSASGRGRATGWP